MRYLGWGGVWEVPPALLLVRPSPKFFLNHLTDLIQIIGMQDDQIDNLLKYTTPAFEFSYSTLQSDAVPMLAPHSPERALIIAVLYRATRDITLTRDCSRLAKPDEQELLRWVLVDASPIDAPFSFKWVCDALGVSRERLGGWFVYIARGRGLALPQERWGYEIDERFIVGIPGELEEDLWRRIRRPRAAKKGKRGRPRF